MDVGVKSDCCGGEEGNASRSQCNYSCPCRGPGSRLTTSFPRALKRKLEKMEEGDQLIGNTADVALVEIEIEAAALREAVGSQQQAIQDLCCEIEEERAASSTAASEAMSMILRLQREKAETQMDFRQFKRFAEEKMSHDQQEIALLEDLLFKRDEAVQSLSCEIQAYRHRLLSYGIEPNSPTETPGRRDTYPPLLRCELAGCPVNAEDSDLKYAAGDTPRDSYRSSSFHRDLNEPPAMADCSSDTFAGGLDDMSDRVYTVDRVGTSMSTPREFVSRRERGCGHEEEDEVRKLYMRLQALEADRETMRKAITSIGTDKAQILLLKEIAQRLYKEAAPERRMIKKPYFMRIFSVMSVLTWVASLFFWWKKPSRIKYPFDSPNPKIGLFVVLDKTPRKRLKRCVTRAPR